MRKIVPAIPFCTIMFYCGWLLSDKHYFIPFIIIGAVIWMEIEQLH